MYVLIGVAAIVIGALLVSPPTVTALWSFRARFGRANAGGLTRTARFDERLMNVAIVFALVGVALVIAGFARGI